MSCMEYFVTLLKAHVTRPYFSFFFYYKMRPTMSGRSIFTCFILYLVDDDPHICFSFFISSCFHFLSSYLECIFSFALISTVSI